MSSSDFAVALKYHSDRNQAPIVVAAGHGYIAQKIIELANHSQVPVYQDNSASALLANFQLGSEIPAELYQIVAEIYAYILKSAEDYQAQQEFEPFFPTITEEAIEKTNEIN